MTIEAPYSKHAKTNAKLLIIVCLMGAVILGYDGYLSKYQWSLRRSFYQEHTTSEGLPDVTMQFNRRVPLVLVAVSLIVAIRYLKIKDRRVIADDNELVISATEKIPYNAIQQIDKTYFDSKGFFTITYKTRDGKETIKALSYKRYDNLSALLDHLVAKIT